MRKTLLNIAAIAAILVMALFFINFQAVIDVNKQIENIYGDNDDPLIPVFQQEYMSEDIKKIINKGYLTVAIHEVDRPEFFCMDKDFNFRGVDVDLAKKIAAFLKVDVKFNRSSKTYDGLTNLLLSDSADIIISTFSITPERSMYIDFSNPYLELRLGVILNKQTLAVNNIEANPINYLKHEKVKLCAQKGSSYFSMGKELFPNAEIFEIEDINLAFELVEKGKIFGFLSGELEFIEQSIKNPVSSIYTKVFTFSDIKDKFCIGIPRESLGLKNFINTCLEFFRKNSIEGIENSYKKSFGSNTKNISN